MTKTIAVASRKGGVAKTTTAANLAPCFVELGLRVLLVDLDPQGHSTLYVGEKPGPEGTGAYHVLANGAAIADVVRTTAFGFDVLTAGEDLVHAEKHLQSDVGSERGLRLALEAVRDRYDVVLCDCPPNLGHLSVAGLVAATSVLVPCMRNSLSLDGLARVNESIRKIVSRGMNPELRLGAILEACVERDQSSHAADVHQELVTKAGELLMRSSVRKSSYFSPAYDAHEPVTAHAPRSIGAEDYRAVARELQERGLA